MVLLDLCGERGLCRLCIQGFYFGVSLGFSRARSCFTKCGASSEFVSSSIPSWQILTAHAQPFRRARYLAFCLKVPLDSLLVWPISGGSGETARMRRLAWTFATCIGDKYQIRLTRPRSDWLFPRDTRVRWFPGIYLNKQPTNLQFCQYIFRPTFKVNFKWKCRYRRNRNGFLPYK